MRHGGLRWGWLAGLAWPGLAQAFCGAYVGPAGDAPSNSGSVVVLSMLQGRTVLTMANDHQGRVEDFGLLVPVPAGFDASAVSVADPDALAALDAYSGPRVVAYTCEDVWDGVAVRNASTYQGGCSGPGTSGGQVRPTRSTGDTGAVGDGTLSDVVVQSHASVGAYDVSVVSADGASGLGAWLDANGLALSPESEPVVQDLLDQGVWFVAVTVTAEVDVPWLSPLQLRYDQEIRALPLKLGTTSSSGVQDLVLYTLAPSRVRITNYPEATIEDECLPPPGDDDFYAEQVDAALDPEPGATDTGGARDLAHWATEYGWNASSCDPCSVAGPLRPGTLSELGWDEPTSPYVTRLRMRYGPEQIEEDALLQVTGDYGTSQLRYVSYAPELEDVFPICGQGFAPEPGSCGPAPTAVADDDGGDGCLCSSVPTGAGVGALGLILASLRRRR